MVFEVGIPLFGVVAADSSVADEENALPGFEDLGQLDVPDVEDVLDELEA